MIESISVRNFQSIRHATVELGRFTVIVGPSDSGKSALMRALRLLISNARGSSFVTHGEKLASVSATTENGTVTLVRGEGHGEYKIHSDFLNQDLVFTKLGGGVPTEVSEFIGIPAADPINFAGQHDAPFLIALPSTQVAKVLGELTNVHIIYGAASEANRRRGAASQTLKIRQADLEEIKTQAATYASLPARLEAMDQAELFMAQVESYASQLETFEKLNAELQVAETALARIQQQYPEPPSTDAMDTALRNLREYEGLLQELASAEEQARNHTAAVAQASQMDEQLHAQLHQLLTEAGVCPTCGQSTKELTHA